MARTVSIGNQDFESIQREGYFYIDKTDFIREWWESGDSVTLITRPRRFGKTLNMSMVEKFFPQIIKTGEICFKISRFGKVKNIKSCREPIRCFS